MSSRRRFLSRAVGALAAGTVAAAANSTPNDIVDIKGRDRRTYLLVHGTGHGGWCWRGVAESLRASGHHVYTPTLTGLGERSHLISREIGLDTHITDVANVAIWEELRDFIIVGHSYGGYVISGVCDRLRERVRHAVYIDAPSPKDGDSNSRGRSLEELGQASGGLIDGYLLPVKESSIAQLGIAADDRADTEWLLRRLTPHPARTWVDRIHLEHGGSVGLPRTYVFCNQAPADSPLRRYADERRKDPTWVFRELPCGHDAMVILPRETARLLASIG